MFEYLSLQVLASVDMSVTLWPKQLGIWAPYVHHCKNEALLGSVLALCVMSVQWQSLHWPKSACLSLL